MSAERKYLRSENLVQGQSFRLENEMFSVLVNTMECQYGLIDNLRTNGCLTEQIQAAVYLPNATRYENNRRLLEWLELQTNESTRKKFLEGLKLSHQGHLADYIENEGDINKAMSISKNPADREIWPIDDSQLEVIKSSYDLLVNGMSRELVDHLLTNDCINERHMEYINSQTTHCDRNRKLLEIILCRSIRHLKIFWKCLQEIDPHLPVALTQNYIEKKSSGYAEKIKKCLSELENRVTQIDQKIKATNKNAQETEDSIMRRFQELKDLLDQQRQRLVDDLRQKIAKREKELQTLREKSERELQMMKSFQRNWSEATARGSACDVVQAASELRTRAEKLIALYEKEKNERELSSKTDYYKIVFNQSALPTTQEMHKLYGKMKELDNHSLDWTRFVEMPTICQSMTSGGSSITDMTLVDDELFVVRPASPDIEVYSVHDLTKPSRRINVPGMTMCVGIAYSEQWRCLFTCNVRNPSYIHKIRLSDNSQTGWGVENSDPSGLSISNKQHILISFENNARIDEYDTSGRLVRKIQLNGERTGIIKAIELNTGQFVLCQYRPDRRICLTDSSGKVIRSSGRRSGIRQIYCQVEVDESGNLLVADSYNRKLQVFSSTLEHFGDVNRSGEKICRLTCFCWDGVRQRLIVGGNCGEFTTITCT